MTHERLLSSLIASFSRASLISGSTWNDIFASFFPIYTRLSAKMKKNKIFSIFILTSPRIYDNLREDRIIYYNHLERILLSYGQGKQTRGYKAIDKAVSIANGMTIA
jgi:hypothetical protein